MICRGWSCGPSTSPLEAMHGPRRTIYSLGYIESGLMLDDAGVQLTREAMLLWNVKRESQL